MNMSRTGPGPWLGWGWRGMPVLVCQKSWSKSPTPEPQMPKVWRGPGNLHFWLAIQEIVRKVVWGPHFESGVKWDGAEWKGPSRERGGQWQQRRKLWGLEAHVCVFKRAKKHLQGRAAFSMCHLPYPMEQSVLLSWADPAWPHRTRHTLLEGLWLLSDTLHLATVPATNTKCSLFD